MPRNHVMRFALGFLALLLGLFPGAAHAQLVITLNPPTQIGPLTYQYTGKIANTSTRAVFVNGAGESGGAAALGFDDIIAALPGGALPFVLGPGSWTEATLFNVTIPVGMGPSSFIFLLAHNGGTVGQATVSLPPVPVAPPTGATVSGTIQLDNSTQFYGQDVSLSFRPKDGSASFVHNVIISRTGAFRVSGIPSNVYTLHIKGATSLAANVPLDTTHGDVSGVTAYLLEGDTNNDNSVDIADFAILISSYSGNAAIPSTGYDYHADFNADGFVDVTDFSMLVNNYSSLGTP